MFTFDRKTHPSSAHSPVLKPVWQHPVKAPPVNLLWFRPAASTNARAAASPEKAKESPPAAAGPQTNFASIPMPPPQVQRKATVSSPGDPFEREADAVADEVMRMAEPARISSVPASIQRECAACEDEERKTIQPERAPSARSGAELDTVAAVRGAERGGEPLPKAARDFFESRFRRDFGRVRVHTDGKAADAARSVQARAYTIGRDIVFGAGAYAPTTAEGKRLLAHELTHVIQQGTAPTSALHDTAEAGRDAVVAGRPDVVPARQSAGTVQREPEDPKKCQEQCAADFDRCTRFSSNAMQCIASRNWCYRGCDARQEAPKKPDAPSEPSAPAVPPTQTPASAPGAPMKVSAPGKTWIGHNEGVRLDHYNDSKGHCTVGIGHLVHKGNCTAAELASPKITEAEAFATFNTDIPPREKFVNDQKFTLTQNEFEAIVDLAFQSWPSGNFSKKVKAGDKEGAAAILGDEKKYPGRGGRRKVLYREGRYVGRGEK
ncbi:MAG: DUF4157 domain-containing protein [Longimicrobiaceae bacterium]